MSFLVRGLLLVGVITGLTSCAGFKAMEGIPEAQLPYHHSIPDLKVSWNTVQTGNDTVINGRMTDIHPTMQIRNIDLLITLSDTEDNRLSEGSVFLEQVNLRRFDSAPFSVTLKGAKIDSGKILKFIVNYRSNDGSWYGHGYQHSFKVDAMTGAVVEEQPKEQ